MEPDAMGCVELSGLPEAGVTGGRVVERRAARLVALEIASPRSQEPRALHRCDCLAAAPEVHRSAGSAAGQEIHLQRDSGREAPALCTHQHH